MRFFTKNWDGKNKISVAEVTQSGDISLKVYDPLLNEITTLIIPGETEVSVSRNLGTFRLKNVWQLGINEKVGGKLLTDTIIKNFHFPIYLWRGSNGISNIPFGDRLMIWLFEKKTKNLQRTEIDLGRAQFLRKTKISDGEVGYRIPNSISDRLIIYFSDNEMVADPPKIYIKDATGAFGVAENIGRTLEVMGGKVFTIEKTAAQQLDCEVRGAFAQKIAKIWNCSIGDGTKLNNFNLELTLGSNFAKRF